MKSDELHEWLTRLAAEAGADVDAAHERMSQAVTALVMCGAVEFRAPYAPAPSLAPPVLPRCDDGPAADCACGSLACGGLCGLHDDGCTCPDCDAADDAAPTAAELHREDSESLDRELSRFAWSGR